MKVVNESEFCGKKAVVVDEPKIMYLCDVPAGAIFRASIGAHSNPPHVWLKKRTGDRAVCIAESNHDMRIGQDNCGLTGLPVFNYEELDAVLVIRGK